MKKKLAVFFLWIVALATIFSYIEEKEPEIYTILKTEAYAHLSENAQNYIIEEYERTGVVIHTEYNKEEGKPYLNPSYANYLALSDEEKKDVELIPTPMVVDYVPIQLESTPSDSYFKLNSNYMTPYKNQGGLGICWAFATAEHIESHVLSKEGRKYTNDDILSPRQIDYAAAFDGTIDYLNEYSAMAEGSFVRGVGDGGNFRMAIVPLAAGLSAVSDDWIVYNDRDYTPLELSKVLNYANSKYEVNETIEMPVIAVGSSEDYIDSYVSEVKSYVKQYGGGVVGTVAPDENCGFKNLDTDKYVIAVDNLCYRYDSGHAMQIIGWDDDYDYKYCKNGSKHEKWTEGCTNTVEGKGVWILRNSWGPYDSEVYLTYDSINAEMGFITDLSETSSRTWSNGYTFGETYSYYKNRKRNTVEVFDVEILDKLKFYTLTTNVTYTVTVEAYIDGVKTRSLTIPGTKEEPGLVTIDFSEVELKGNSYIIDISASGSEIGDQLFVFTNNVDENEIKIQTDNYTYSNDPIRIYSTTRNIPSNATIDYRLYDEEGNDYSSLLSYTHNVVAKNDVNTLLEVNGTISAGDYNLVAVYNDEEISSSTLTLSRDLGDVRTYIIKYNANGGIGEMNNQMVVEGSQVTLNPNGYTKEGYEFKGWCTSENADVVYEDEETINSLDKDLDLYAVWEIKKVHITYNANGGVGNMRDDAVEYNFATFLTPNRFTKEGYNFKGWSTTPDGEVEYSDGENIFDLKEDLNLYAVWEIKKVNVSFNANGGSGTMDSLELDYNGSSILQDNAFTKEGYDFKGWSTTLNGNVVYQNKGTITNVKEDITLYAVWEIKKFTVTYNANGGNKTMNNQIVNYGNNITLSDNLFEKEGYNFKGWSTTLNGSVVYQNKATITNVKEDINLYAVWEIKKFTVRYNANDGSGTMSNQEINYGSNLTIADNGFTKEGYEFIGWSTKADGKVEYAVGYSFTYKLDNDLTLYAVWRRPNYQITYDGNGGEGVIEPQEGTSNEGVTLNKNTFIRNGYIFQGWSTTPDGTVVYLDQAHISDIDFDSITLYAVWKKYTYQITYVLNGGVNNASNPYGYEKTTPSITLKNPTKVGYTFKGWYSDSKYKKKVTSIAKGSTGNKTLYAKWEVNTYTIKFVGNGSTSGKMSSMTKRSYGKSYTLTNNAFKRKGYTFIEWNTKADGTGTSYKNKASVKNLTSKNGATVTLYAIWKKNTYTITYKPNGGTNNSANPSTYTVTTATISLKNPTKVGYTFKGWYNDSKFKKKVTSIKKGSTGNMTLYAKWTANTYTIKFVGNGATSGKMSNLTKRTYDKSYTLTNNAFKRTGYTFVEWNTKADGTGTSYKNKASVKNLTSKNGATVTLYAIWKENTYQINYALNGGVNNSSNPGTYKITTPTITLANPTKDGYSFNGWYSDSKFKTKVTSIKKGSTGNKSLYAKWTIVKYNITYELDEGVNNSSNPNSYYVTTSTITLVNPTKEGYTFAGWYSEPEYINEVTTIDQGSIGNKTLYAKWIQE